MQRAACARSGEIALVLLENFQATLLDTGTSMSTRRKMRALKNYRKSLFAGNCEIGVTCVKIQVYLRKEELDALRKAAARSGRSVAELVPDAIRKVVLTPQAAGPVAIWDGEPRRTSIEHDSVHDAL